MGIEIRTCQSDEEFFQAFGVIAHYFGGPPAEEERPYIGRVFESDRTLVARESDLTVGGAGAHTFELTVPGGFVPAAGVTIVGVAPMKRRRGILTSMMRAQLDDVRRRGEPVAYLWASEESIYGRFGYGMASLMGIIDLPKNECTFARPTPPRGELRFVGVDDGYSAIAGIYDRLRGDYPGMFARKEDWWKARRLADLPSRRRGGGELNRVVLSLDGKDEGYALYRFNMGLEGGITSSAVSVLEAIGTTPEATREIWRFLFEIDWCARVKAMCLPVDHPLFFLLSHPRQMRMWLGDALWVRLVDVEAALAARRFGQADPVVLEVKDPFCPWNDGRYRVGPDGAKRVDAAADITMDVEGLGSVYLGGFTFTQLAMAGRVVVHGANALGRADALFRGERLPWCPEIF